MRSKFPGYYSLSNDELDEMWDKAIIVLDTNVLLDFYRVSPETQSDLLSLLGYFGEHNRLWIPYQVALEYHSDLYKVVFDQMSHYDDTLDILKKFLSSITQKRNHPFLNDNLINRANNFIKDIGRYFESQKKKLKESVDDSSFKGKDAHGILHLFHYPEIQRRVYLDKDAEYFDSLYRRYLQKYCNVDEQESSSTSDMGSTTSASTSNFGDVNEKSES